MELLHKRERLAHARGARIQVEIPGLGGTRPAWFLCRPTWGEEGTYRVHPDDTHLEYGPISRRLREAALYGSTPMNYVLDADDNHEMDLRSKALDYVQCHLASHDGQDNCRTYLLFEAERLADEGL